MVTPTVGLDFEAGPLIDLGITVTRTPVTISTNNITGQKVYTDGTDEDIKVVWNNPSKKYNLQESGNAKTADGVMYTKSSQTINKHDKILYSSQTYRVMVVNERLMDNVTGFKKVELFLI